MRATGVRWLATVVVATALLASCATKADPTTTPSTSTTSTTSTNSTTAAASAEPVVISPAPAPGWQDVESCPETADVSDALGTDYRDGTTDGDLTPAGNGCQYLTGQGDDVQAIDVMVLGDSLDRLRGIWTNPPPSVVRDAPELGAGAVIVHTPDTSGIRQCLVGTTVTAGTLIVQVTDRRTGSIEDLCAPLGPMLTVLAGA